MLQLGWSPSAMCFIAGTPLLLGCLILMWLRTQAHFRHGPDTPIEAPPPVVAQPSA
jgi:hypothetical protein